MFLSHNYCRVLPVRVHNAVSSVVTFTTRRRRVGGHIIIVFVSHRRLHTNERVKYENVKKIWSGYLIRRYATTPVLLVFSRTAKRILHRPVFTCDVVYFTSDLDFLVATDGPSRPENKPFIVARSHHAHINTTHMHTSFDDLPTAAVACLYTYIYMLL